MRLYLDEEKVIPQAAIGVTGAQTLTGIDAKGYSQARVTAHVAAYATNAFTVFKIQTSEASDFSSGVTDLFELNAAGLTAASAADAVVAQSFDIRNANRYLRVIFTKGTGNATVAVHWTLSGAQSSPLTAADKGLNSEFVAA